MADFRARTRGSTGSSWRDRKGPSAGAEREPRKTALRNSMRRDAVQNAEPSSSGEASSAAKIVQPCIDWEAEREKNRRSKREAMTSQRPADYQEPEYDEDRGYDRGGSRESYDDSGGRNDYDNRGDGVSERDRRDRGDRPKEFEDRDGPNWRGDRDRGGFDSNGTEDSTQPKHERRDDGGKFESEVNQPDVLRSQATSSPDFEVAAASNAFGDDGLGVELSLQKLSFGERHAKAPGAHWGESVIATNTAQEEPEELEEVGADVPADVASPKKKVVTLTKKAAPSTAPNPNRVVKRNIDRERQAEIDADFGMEAEADTGHMLELYELDTVDPHLLLPLLGDKCIGLHQITPNQMIAVYPTKTDAQHMLGAEFPAGKVMQLYPLRLQQFSHLLPQRLRPETSSSTAKRVIFHNLSIRRTKEERDAERAQRRRSAPPAPSQDAWGDD